MSTNVFNTSPETHVSNVVIIGNKPQAETNKTVKRLSGTLEFLL